MSLLRVYLEDVPEKYEEFTDHRLAAVLAENRITFERWTAHRTLTQGASQEEILTVYEARIGNAMRQYGYVTADVISVHAGTPQREELRRKFLREHTHTEDEARFFVRGSGLFYLHLGSRVFGVLCEQGDFLMVPAATKHWFDLGTTPDLQVIRTFSTPEGWIASYTGSDIALRFPTLDEFSAASGRSLFDSRDTLRH